VTSHGPSTHRDGRETETAARGHVPVKRFAFRMSAGLVGVVAAGVLFWVLLALVCDPWTPLERVDRAVARSLNALFAGSEIAVNVARGVTQFGGWNFLVLVLLVGSAYLVIRGRPRLAVYVITTSVGAPVLDPVVKLFVERLRPVVDIPISTGWGPGFPSGHALGSVVSYGVLLLVFLPTARRHRWLAVGLVATLVVLVGATRLALGVHYLTDVLGGWALGIAWLGVTAVAFRRWRADAGEPAAPVSAGLDPDSAEALAAAPEPRPLPHPVLAATELAVVAVLTVGIVFGAGLLVTNVLADTAVGRADRAVVAWFTEHRSSGWTAVMSLFNSLGATRWIITVTVGACGLALGIFRRWRPVVFLIMVMAGEIVVFLIASTAVTRGRPQVPHLQPDLPPTASFPSGHVAGTVCLYGALALLTWRATDIRWIRWIAVVAAVLAPAMVAVARMYQGVHYPTDIVGSVLLAGLWLFAVRLILLRRQDPDG
jgi:undecaprenyl-diphosphatase